MEKTIKVASLENRVNDLEAALKCALEVIDEQKKALSTFRAATCKVGWALGFPGGSANSITGFVELKDGYRHCHEMLTHDAREACAALAALDDSGYAPTQERVRYTPSDSAQTRAEWQHPVGGGSRKDKPLLVHGILGEAQPSPTGFKGAVEGESCDLCGQADSAHLCPAVSALGPVLDGMAEDVAPAP
jgi:hypothetical protein